MLNIFPAQQDPSTKQKDASLSGALWIDLFGPTDAEMAEVEAATGVRLPSIDALSEIKSSSRLRHQNGVFYLSTPSAVRHQDAIDAELPVGLVLSQNRLITIRFVALAAFDEVSGRLADGREAPRDSLEILILLCEEIVDRIADLLEHSASDLNRLASRIFHTGETRSPHAARENRLLRKQLRTVGQLGDKLSEIRDGLQGLGRVLAYISQHAGNWSGGTMQPRLTNLDRDIRSLIDYEERLASKVQFVMDGLIGLTGIAENEIVKVLTIISLVGIPPTLVAGIYGMNFKHMPELDWAWGYPLGWAMIIFSAIIPIIWFKWRGWF